MFTYPIYARGKNATRYNLYHRATEATTMADIRECECEHTSHFGDDTGARDVHAHAYLCEREISEDRATPYATFPLCRQCVELGHMV